jgi:site-specific DNA recombinase
VKIVGYTRRSRERHNGFGLEAQADAIRRWADYESVEVVDIVEDDDVSGFADPMARASLSRALDMLRAGQAEALVVAKFDRLARSIIGFADVLRLSQDQGWQLVCLDPMLDLRRAHDRAMAGMLIGFADVEREAFTMRMQGGRRAKAERGGYVGGGRLHERYGWRLVRDDLGKLDYEPKPDEQAVIANMRQLRSEGATLQHIANRLTAQGTPPPSGPRWHPATIQRILKREASA